MPGRGVVSPRAWGLVASEVAVLLPPPAEPASFWLQVGCLVYSGPTERSARCGWPGLCAEGEYASQRSASREKGREEMGIANHICSRLGKERKSLQFSYRSTGTACVRMGFVSIVFSRSCDRSHGFKPVVHTVLYPAFLVITYQPFPIIIYSFRTHHFGRLVFH